MPTRRWGWRGWFGAASLVALVAAAQLWLGPAQASAGGLLAAGRGPEVTLRVSSLYSVSVIPGTWVPVTIAVTNRGASDLHGQVVLTSQVARVVQPGSQVCYTSSNGSTTCTVTGLYSYGGYFSYGGFSQGYSAGASTTRVEYKSPLDLAPGTTKVLVTDVLVDSAQASVEAEALGASGQVLAKGGDQLQVEAGNAQAAVLVVTNDPGELSSLSLPLPDGPQPQVQILSPAEVPGSSAALGAFSAVVVDEADTSALSTAQGRAIEGYVEAGGTLVVAGGLSWRAAMAGLPAGLLPARVKGTTALVLAQLSHLLGARPPAGRVDVDELVMSPGSSVILSEGSTPLAVEAGRGSGYVVVSAFDPAAAPLATWVGAPAVVSRLLASAYSEAYNQQANVVLSGGVVSFGGTVAGQPPSRAALMNPAQGGSALGAYLEQMPGAALPSAHFLGMLLVGYIVVAGPLCFLVLARLRRRHLAWVVLPGVAVVAALVAYESGAGLDRSPLSEQIQVVQLAAGSNLAQVSSMGAIYLPRGGSSQVTLASLGPVTDLGAGAGGDLTVGPGTAPGTSGLSVGGPHNSLGGWAASEDASLHGSVEASAQESAGTLRGRVTNRLGVDLNDVFVVDGAVEADIGALGPGRSARFSLAAPSKAAAGGNGAGVLVSSPFLSSTALAGSAAARHQFAMEGLYALASQYSEAAGEPVMFGLAATPFLPARTGADVAAHQSVDAVIVPLTPTERPGLAISGLAPELVGSHRVMGSSSVLGQGGFFDYQYLLPGARWRHLGLDLGSPAGSAGGAGTSSVVGIGVSAGPTSNPSAALPGDFALSAFDYRRGRWEPLKVSLSSGHFRARIPGPSAYIGPGGSVEVRLTSLTPGLEVFGPVPALSAQPGAPTP